MADPISVEAGLLVQALREIGTKQEGYGMSYRADSPIARGGAEINLYGKRASAAHWLTMHGAAMADLIEAALANDARRSEVDRLKAAIENALSDLNTPGHLGGTRAVGGTNGIAMRLRAALSASTIPDVGEGM